MSSGTRVWFARVVAIAGALSLIGLVVADAEAEYRPAQQPAAAESAIRLPIDLGAATVRVSAVRHHPGSVFVVGDSLTVGTEPWLGADLRHRGWRLAGLDARIGRPVAEGLQVLRANSATLPGTVVIALGTNDLGADRATVISWLSSARAILGHRRIIWVDLCLAASVDPGLAAYRSINAVLSEFAPQYGVEVADWCSYAHAHGLNPGPDHIHYTAGEYRRRASFYAAVVAG